MSAASSFESMHSTWSACWWPRVTRRELMQARPIWRFFSTMGSATPNVSPTHTRFLSTASPVAERLESPLLPSGPAGVSQTTGTITQPSKREVVGTKTVSGARTSYFRFLVLDAVDLKEFRATAEVTPVWRTTVTSSGSSGDLRRVFPVLAAAASDHVGTNTGQAIRVDIYETDRRVKIVKGLVEQSASGAPETD